MERRLLKAIINPAMIVTWLAGLYHALQRPKRFFGAARNIEEGGSLTIIASLVDSSGQNPRAALNPTAALEIGSLVAATRCAETSAAWTSSRRNPTPGSRASSWARGRGQPDAKLGGRRLAN
jgi:hypothetical protein